MGDNPTVTPCPRGTPDVWWPPHPASPLATLASPAWLSLGGQGPVLPLALGPRLVPLGLPLLGRQLQGLLVAGFADGGGAVLGQQLPATGSGLPRAVAPRTPHPGPPGPEVTIPKAELEGHPARYSPPRPLLSRGLGELGSQGGHGGPREQEATETRIAQRPLRHQRLQRPQRPQKP